jgi:hypothetical protein
MNHNRRSPRPRQLRLLGDGRDWDIDEHTRAIGLAGIAAARRAVEEARRRPRN